VIFNNTETRDPSTSEKRGGGGEGVVQTIINILLIQNSLSTHVFLFLSYYNQPLYSLLFILLHTHTETSERTHYRKARRTTMPLQRNIRYILHIYVSYIATYNPSILCCYHHHHQYILIVRIHIFHSLFTIYHHPYHHRIHHHHLSLYHHDHAVCIY